jgi:phosphocarrier protein
VAGPHGLHARPAARFVRAVQASGLPVRVDRADGAGAGPVNAASILGVLRLGVRGGEEIVLSCEDTDGDPDGGGRAEAVLGRLAELVSGNSPDESRNTTP